MYVWWMGWRSENSLKDGSVRRGTGRCLPVRHFARIKRERRQEMCILIMTNGLGMSEMQTGLGQACLCVWLFMCDSRHR